MVISNKERLGGSFDKTIGYFLQSAKCTHPEHSEFLYSNNNRNVDNEISRKINFTISSIMNHVPHLVYQSFTLCLPAVHLSIGFA